MNGNGPEQPLAPSTGADPPAHSAAEGPLDEGQDVPPYERIYRSAMARIEAITQQWTQTIDEFTRRDPAQ